MPHLKKEIVIILMILAIAVLFLSSAKLQLAFEQAITALSAYIASHHVLGISVFIGLGALSAMLSPFSSMPLVPAAVVIWGNTLTFLFLLIGWLLGGMAAYAIGRYVVYHLFKDWEYFKKIQSYRGQVSENSEFILVLLFRMIMPAEIPGYLLGIIKYSFPKYLLATFLAELPVAFLAVHASDALVDERPVKFFMLFFAGVVLLALTIYQFRKRLKP